VPGHSDILDYDVGQLHAGWYVDWGVRLQAPRPAGLEHVQIIRLCDDACPDRVCGGQAFRPYGTQLATAVSTNPGTLWLIGNEPDTRYGNQDCVRPDRYAELYHELYYLLKGLDPTSQVAIGGVVQATPLRLQYLDIIWDTYQTLYRERMPVDVWNVHNFILREQEPGWGCGIPPGIAASEGELREIDDHDSVAIFEEQVRAFREWMRDKGERNKPLIISEYGVLFPEELGFDYERVRDFMLSSFDFFVNTIDTEIGYPPDGNRLVQRWAWYSLDDNSFECSTWDPPCATWSNLFNPTSKEIESLGQEFGSYVVDHGLILSYHDLEPVTLTLQSEVPLVYGESTTLTLASRVVNWGNNATGPFALSFSDGTSLLDEFAITDGLAPRYEGQTVVETSWTDPVTRPHTFYVVADSHSDVDEWHEDNNETAVELDVDLSIGQFRSSVPLAQPGQSADIRVTARASL
jgi:hypothetical protein